MNAALRRFKDAPSVCRCQATVHLKDGTTAQCGRYRKLGVHCTQHSKIVKQQSTNRTTDF
jgi:uncharacterized Fe-S cluster-containing protein